MKTKTKFSLKKSLLVFCLFIGVHAFAQQDSSAARNMTDKMKTQLSLTDDQYNKVFTTNESFIGQMKALKTSGGSRFSKFKKMKSIDSDRDKQMQQILTNEQYQAFQKNKAANREKMKDAMKGNN